MGRPVVLSNAQLFVGLDEGGLVHDFYFPYVGLENLTNARSCQHKIGVWVDGVFRWTNDGTWEIDVRYEADKLIGAVTMHSTELGITIQTRDFVDSDVNAFVRTLTITNEREQQRDVRLFMHQVFQISRAGRADTALYVPDDHYILDYKGRCCLLIAGKIREPSGGAKGLPFDQYAVGSYAVEGKAGTYIDAEDGELGGNAVEHGGVDSVIRFQQTLEPKAACVVDYWVVAAESQMDAQLIHTRMKYYPIEDRYHRVQQFWQHWLAGSERKLATIANEKRSLAIQSMLTIKAHCDRRGSILASGDSSIFNYGRDYYCYCWPRDAAYALWPLIRSGQYQEALNFFEFARDTMHRDGYLMHKYQPDRAIGSTWHPLVHGRARELAIQEDETALVVYMMHEYYAYSHDKQFVDNYYDSFIFPCAQFMSTYIDTTTGLPHASYDLWEEKFLTSTYTVTAVVAALEAAAQLASVAGRVMDGVRWQAVAESMRHKSNVLVHPDGYYRKGYLLQSDGSMRFDDTVDISSLYGVYMFMRLPDQDSGFVATLQKIESALLNSSPIGGVIRYEQDHYFRTKEQYPGNPWIVCSLWLAQIYIAIDRTADAQKLMQWSQDRALPSGALSEQFDPDSGAPLSVTPLVWSHAELVNTIFDLKDDKS